MKNASCLIVLLLCTLQAFCGVITLEGFYQGKNVLVQNPFSSSGIGFCTTDVLVNDVRTTDEIQSSTFEIDLEALHLKVGDRVKLTIKHKDGCQPKLLNPEVLKPKSTFEIVTAKADESGTIRWTTRNEGAPIPFQVEQFKWNKWVAVDAVDGKGGAAEKSYTVKADYHSGINRFRILQADVKGSRVAPKEVIYKSLSKPVSFSPEKPSKELVFSAETSYEIYDEFGKLIVKGRGNKVDVSTFKKGPYYLNYDNETKPFYKK